MSTTQHGILKSLFLAKSRKFGRFKEIWGSIDGNQRLLGTFPVRFSETNEPF